MPYSKDATYKPIVIIFIIFLFFTQFVIIICNKNNILRDTHFLKYKKALHLQPKDKRKTTAYFTFIYPYNKLYIRSNEKNHKLNDDLKNIILLFGRIAEPYYPHTIEQFNNFKEPYSKYIYTDNIYNSTKWANVFKDNEKVNKKQFYQKICQLKFKWPINEDENITEHDFYNLVIERCLNNINIIRNNIHNLKTLFIQILQKKQIYNETNPYRYNNEKDTFIEKEEISRAQDLYNKWEKELFTSSAPNEEGISSSEKNVQMQNDMKMKMMEELYKFNLSDMFKQHNRSYTRLLVNELFTKEYPSKRITDMFLYLIFQKDIEGFSYEEFIMHLNILGKKILLYNCNHDSNIYFDSFFFLMKNEIKKKSNHIKKKTQIPFSDSKVMKTKKHYTINKNAYCDNKNQIKIIKNKPNHNIISQTGMKKKIKSHQNPIKINQNTTNQVLGKDKMQNCENCDKIKNISNQSSFLLPQNLDNQIDIDHNEKTKKNIQRNTQIRKNCLKTKLIFIVNYILNTIKNIF
ncbi:conserved Plasmodium protein, unknown function [Plasmodium berghei]|uniref:Uncharacterized protein n=2 Tax=Plasmodium berghei TaxID=5821 RepID=A0A509ATE6_PLABA|nr:conserved Plasmodium protein, unknown function [Plasmodium berghei ANKA]CXI72412.1 conserved Plasmodium protein, unknown function [Plasmodium berghei]SCM24404.1 conserved Plasmodium protein, unknown function [Plasmodium berghei]SCN27053.1 conserved Plasmodium protein, unknown function [Plasmodium berghei]SCO61530.1 conserved Plasmodium protein, unknown function [Plasmodium berghei]SCO63475.1 conserved Plasmodium protein, unknown function [Plasmodium berghei]|eukprot:XP_034422687.1 conserved Plasmodium protein, unknown function [Plasmodium berghei ANKA]